MNIIYNIQKQVNYIPLGMYRSVEMYIILSNLHSGRDASLTGCKAIEKSSFLPNDASLWDAENTNWKQHTICN
jgi:hypothetical protein